MDDGYSIDEVAKIIGVKRWFVERFIENYDGVLFNRSSDGKIVFDWPAIKIIRDKLKPANEKIVVKEKVVVKRVNQNYKTQAECMTHSNQMFKLMSDYFVSPESERVAKKKLIIQSALIFANAKKRW